MKLGRQPRAFNPRVPHMSALLAGKKLITPPPTCDYTQGMPSGFGMMLNDNIGDCTCAAYYHARQTWSFNAAKAETTESDQRVLQLYEESCGYSPNDPNSDQGGVEQDVLQYLVQEGAPIGDGNTREKLLAFVEVDFRNLDDIKRTIFECGGVYIGFNVPDTLMDNGPPQVWADTSSQNIIGGHAVWLPGYTLDGPIVVSWGSLYAMSWGFFASYMEEAYALYDGAWLDSSGQTPAGMSVAELESQMAALRNDII